MSELREYEVESNGEKRTYLLNERDAAQMPGAVLVKAAEPKTKQATPKNKAS